MTSQDAPAGERVRIGFGLGTRTGSGEETRFRALVDDLERLDFDSLWLSERISSSAPDPVVGMAHAAGRTDRLKLGMSVMVLPGRRPALVAKALASLDRLSGGRLLPAFGLGVADPREQRAFGVDRAERARRFDDDLDAVRRLWAGDEVDGVTVRPLPVQDPLEVWLGGRAPRELRRVGRVGDGWLPSFCDASDISEGRAAIQAAATEAGRRIDPGHFGALVAYTHGPVPEPFAKFIRQRRPDLDDPHRIVPRGHDGLRATLLEMIDAGASKFVVLPMAEPDEWAGELEALAEAVLPLQQ